MELFLLLTPHLAVVRGGQGDKEAEDLGVGGGEADVGVLHQPLLVLHHHPVEQDGADVLGPTKQLHLQLGLRVEKVLCVLLKVLARDGVLKHEQLEDDDDGIE